MLFDTSTGGEGGFEGPWCVRCNQPIQKDDSSQRISFPNDPHGHQGLTGLYHDRCAKPFSSLARIMNMNPWSR